jgi:hypothetical protein
MKRRQFLNSLLASAVGLAAGSYSVNAIAAKRGRPRPASPNSVAGVGRRTRRRRRRRVRRNMQVSSLPYGCSVTRVRGGVTYYYCGSIWYEPVYQGTTVVYIVNEIEAGANTDVEFDEYE